MRLGVSSRRSIAILLIATFCLSGNGEANPCSTQYESLVLIDLRSVLSENKAKDDLTRILATTLRATFAGRGVQLEAQSQLEAQRVLYAITNGTAEMDRLARVMRGDVIEKSSEIFSALAKREPETELVFQRHRQSAAKHVRGEIPLAEFSEEIDRLSSRQKELFASINNMRFAGARRGTADSYVEFQVSQNRTTLDRFSQGYLELTLDNILEVLQQTQSWSPETLEGYARALRTISAESQFN